MTPPTLSWAHPPESLMLTNADVHVWVTSLDRSPPEINSLQQTLTPDEQARAKRFRFEKHRDNFIVGRGVLRAILSRYLAVCPSQLHFEYTSYGKPMLAEAGRQNAPASEALNFNLSHSHELALYAVTQEQEIGVDVEYIRTNVDVLGIAKRFFSAQEFSELQALPQAHQTETFFDCWTRKEAFIKAKGEGLSLPLDQFDVSITPGNPAALLSTQWNPDEATNWSLQALTPAPGYAAALAVEGKGWHLQTWVFGAL